METGFGTALLSSKNPYDSRNEPPKESFCGHPRVDSTISTCSATPYLLLVGHTFWIPLRAHIAPVCRRQRRTYIHSELQWVTLMNNY